MTPLLFAKFGAVLSIFYAGTNIYQLMANFEEVQNRAKQFTEIAKDVENASRLQMTRIFFYVGVPLSFIGTFMGAGLPVFFLYIVSAKFTLSAWLGMTAENRLMRGEVYRMRDHVMTRADACANLGLAAGAVWLLLRQGY